MSFNDLRLIEPLLRAVEGAGYATPTPIQAQSIPVLLSGRDLCGTAQTGTGKTAAFALPILQKLAGAPGGAGPRALVLAPTRELALQIAESFKTYGKNLPELKCAVVYGGMGMRAQRRAMEAGVDVLVATTGRLLDLCRQGSVKLDKVEVLVLDEADRMLDMGFIEDVRTVVRLVPVKRQSVLFSATMPAAVEKLANLVLKSPIRVSVAAPAAVASGIEERVIKVAKSAKRAKLMEILADPAVTKAVVFVRTRDGADRLERALAAAGVKVGAVHGDKPQAERFRAIGELASGAVRVLVATDVAARGLDIDGITHVINYDLPNVAETYVHRIGRTGRAGAVGLAISLVSPDEYSYLEEIEWQAGKSIPVLP